jgi:hypothetical protein
MEMDSLYPTFIDCSSIRFHSSDSIHPQGYSLFVLPKDSSIYQGLKDHLPLSLSYLGNYSIYNPFRVLYITIYSREEEDDYGPFTHQFHLFLHGGINI